MTTDHQEDPPRLVALALLVAEGFGQGSVDTLAHDLGDDVILDDVGIRCITRGQARTMIAERAARQAAQREREKARAAEFAANNPMNEVREFVAAIQRQQAEAKIDFGDDVSMPKAAFAVMTAGDYADLVAASDDAMAEMITGEMTYHFVKDDGGGDGGFPCGRPAVPVPGIYY